MNTYTSKTHDSKLQAAANTVTQKRSSSKPTLHLVDNRPKAVAQRKLITNSNSPIQFNPTKLLKMFMKSPAYVPDKGLNPNNKIISFIGSQFDPKYRTAEHKEVLNKNKNEPIYKTFNRENKFAANYPFEGAYSKLGMMGIGTHKAYRAGGKILWGENFHK